jgi:hypothetical protein
MSSQIFAILYRGHYIVSTIQLIKQLMDILVWYIHTLQCVLLLFDAVIMAFFKLLIAPWISLDQV